MYFLMLIKSGYIDYIDYLVSYLFCESCNIIILLYNKCRKKSVARKRKLRFLQSKK